MMIHTAPHAAHLPNVSLVQPICLPQEKSDNQLLNWQKTFQENFRKYFQLFIPISCCTEVTGSENGQNIYK